MQTLDALRAEIGASSTPAETIEELAQSARARKSNAERAESLGLLALSCEGEHDGLALRYYQEAFRLAPRDARFLEASEHIYERLGKPELAAKLRALRQRVAGRPRPATGQAPAESSVRPRVAKVRAELARTLLVNAAFPYVVYVVAKPRVGGFDALLASAVPPTLESLWSVARRRRLDLVASLVLGGIAASLAVMALGGSERILLVRESLITGLFGLVLAVSALTPYPLIYLIGRQATAAREPERAESWQRRWTEERSFRASLRLITAVLGVGLVAEVTVRAVMAFKMRVSTFLIASPLVQYGFIGAVALWTFGYARRLRSSAPAQPDLEPGKANHRGGGREVEG